MALTNDIKPYEYGVPDGSAQLVAYPVAATQQLYYGAIALVSGGTGGIAKGYLKNAASPASTDLVAGIVGEAAGGTYVQTGPGILGGATDGAVWDNVRPGSFYFQGGSGADALSESLVGTTVYYQGENSTGPIAAATDGGGTRPKMGVLLPRDPGIAGGFTPGSAYWPVKLNIIGGP